jgi:hypothetical protein
MESFLAGFLLKEIILKSIARVVAGTLVIILLRSIPKWLALIGLLLLIWWCLN